MYRGETITTAVCNLPIPPCEIQSVYMTFKTLTTTLLEKSPEDCEILSDGTIECTLTQEESLALPLGPIFRSAIIITKGGARFERICDELIVVETGRREVLT